MTLLLVNKYHFLKGGAERYYLDLGEKLRSQGDRVICLSMRHPENLPGASEDRFLTEVDYRATATVSQRVRQAARSIYNREAEQAVRDIAQRNRPAAAHLHNIYHQLSPSVIRALDDEGIPIVQTLHDYKLICPGYLLLTEGSVCERCRGGRYYQAFLHRCLLESRAPSFVGMLEAYVHRWARTYEKVRTFICPSRFLLEKVASFGIARERLAHLPYFLPIERYEPRGAGTSYYVFAGRLSREKGVATLIEAHASLPRTRLPLRVLGDGPIRPELVARARELGADDIVFEGYLKPPRLHDVIGGALFIAVPSEWYENYPYAILEAFALGRPVVGARIGGIPELVRDQETGFTAAAGDPAALAEALAAMMADPAAAHAMGRSARAWVAAELAPGPHIDRLRAIYEGAAR
jgi:glycosyltransferase involved in cell wall biosynthesis